MLVDHHALAPAHDLSIPKTSKPMISRADSGVYLKEIRNSLHLAGCPLIDLGNEFFDGELQNFLGKNAFLPAFTPLRPSRKARKRIDFQFPYKFGRS
jgi:hypothetical protein